MAGNALGWQHTLGRAEIVLVVATAAGKKHENLHWQLAIPLRRSTAPPVRGPGRTRDVVSYDLVMVDTAGFAGYEFSPAQVTQEESNATQNR